MSSVKVIKMTDDSLNVIILNSLDAEYPILTDLCHDIC